MYAVVLPDLAYRSLPGRFKHGYTILRGYICHNTLYLMEDKSPIGTHDLRGLSDVLCFFSGIFCESSHLWTMAAFALLLLPTIYPLGYQTSWGLDAST